MNGNHTLFISYRRDDASGWAGRLQSDLRSRLGPGTQVFMDVDSIPAGEDFARYIDQVVGQSDAVIALIGPAWASTTQDGKRRLDDPGDFVRLEIEAALQRGIRVIPALVDGVPLPRRAELPASLHELTQREALQLDNTSWDLAVSRLVTSLTRENEAPPKLALSTNRLDFGQLTTQDQWPRKTVQIRNEGGGELSATATTSDSWILVRNRSDAVDVLVDTSNPGEYSGRIIISSAGGTAVIGATASVQPSGGSRPSTPWTVAPEPNVPTTGYPPTVYQSSGHTSAPQLGGVPPGYPPPYMPVVPTYMPVVPTNMTMAVIALVLFFPTGIPAVVYASRVSSLKAVGDYAGALAASKLAKTWSIVSFVLCVLVVIGTAGSAGSAGQ